MIPADADVRLLARAGVLLFLASLLTGLFIQSMPLPRLALSAHLVGLGGSLFLIALAALWRSLEQGARASRVAAMLAIYGFWGGWLEYLAAAATGTGGRFPMASGQTRGSPTAEAIVSITMVTIVIALIGCGILVFRALGRRPSPTAAGTSGGTVGTTGITT